MKNDSNPIIRSQEVTIDMHICAALSESRGSGEIYFAAIAPDMELTVITLDEAPDILPCFDEDDAYLNIPDSSLLLSYNPAQVLKLAGKRYLTGPVILVRTNIVFDKYVYEGYGPQHIATYLNNSGYRARSGKCWHPSSIRGMVQNLTYTGVLRCGDARSELMPDLQIVPQEQFENAQRIRNERSVRSTAEAENRLPLNIHGKSLLAGNAYCGHCGAKLELTSSRKWRKMADGSLDDTLRIRYTCYGKLRKQTNCTGQTGYTVHILDEIIDKAVRQIFSKMRGIPKEQIVTKRYEKENAERKNHLQDLQTQRNKAEKDLFALKTEVLACIKGESVLPRETLAEMITAQEEKLTELENLCEAASEELEKTAELMDKVSRLYDELISYADLYDSANFEAKKMIVNQLIRRVDVYRGYQINISFNFDLTPYIEGE